MVKKIAIHQPNYLPWLGFFMKTALSDVLVLHDNVQYTKGGPTRRCMLRKENIIRDFFIYTATLLFLLKFFH
jgi:WbqC-like protein family